MRSVVDETFKSLSGSDLKIRSMDKEDEVLIDDIEEGDDNDETSDEDIDGDAEPEAPVLEISITAIEKEEWFNIDILCNILKPFHDWSQCMEAEQYPTISMVLPAVHDLLSIIAPRESDFDLRRV